MNIFFKRVVNKIEQIKIIIPPISGVKKVLDLIFKILDAYHGENIPFLRLRTISPANAIPKRPISV